MRHVHLLSCLFLLSFLLAGCGAMAAPPPPTPTGPAVVVSSKPFTESYLLGEMYAQLFEANGIPVERKLGQGFEGELHAAMRADLIDVYPEYTSTGLLAILKETPLQGEEVIYQRVKSEYEAQFDVVWLDRTPFNNTWALATRRDIAEKYDLETIDQLPEFSQELRIGGTEGFFDREDGLPGLEEAYGRMRFAGQVFVSGEERYRALREGEIDVVAAYGTDGEIEGDNLVLLRDTKDFWPPYNAAPLVRREIIEQYPAIPNLLNPLAPLLTQEVMTELNWKVDGPEKRSHEEVARAFLEEHHLLPAPQTSQK